MNLRRVGSHVSGDGSVNFTRLPGSASVGVMTSLIISSSDSLPAPHSSLILNSSFSSSESTTDEKARNLDERRIAAPFRVRFAPADADESSAPAAESPLAAPVIDPALLSLVPAWPALLRPPPLRASSSTGTGDDIKFAPRPRAAGRVMGAASDDTGPLVVRSERATAANAPAASQPPPLFTEF